MEDIVNRIHRILVSVLIIILCIELVVVLFEGLWMNGFLILGIIAVTLFPLYLGRQYRIDIPSEFQILAIIFVFASLFLGEIYQYYEKIWWWDMLLHASSGLLMGILGFLLVYLLTENERAEIDMTPKFVAFFAFLFAVTTGTLWEIFEFAMDRLTGTDMQKPMAGDPSGLTDTMWDMIINTAGALIISGLGWYYMVMKRQSFIQHWIRKFIRRNPRLFRRYRG